MTTYNTGNPLGSTAAKDLYDNAQNFDFALNSLTQVIWLDRFGVGRRSWYGLEVMVADAAGAYGIITLTGVSFTTGATVHLNEALLNTANNEYYKWTGTFPPDGKVVPPSSSPESTGGIGPGKWLSVGDAALRQQLASDSVSLGDALVATKQPFTGAKNQTVHTKLAQVINVLDFDGVVGDGVNDDTSGIQAAVNATPWGGDLLITNKTFSITDEIIIDKPINIRGSGGSILTNSQSSKIIQKTAGKNVFKLKASLNGYLFGQYGLNGGSIKDITLEGPSNTTRAAFGIACDETVNNGGYHIRGWVFDNIKFKYFTYGILLRGIIYLNSFTNLKAAWCNCAYLIDALPTSGDLSGQNRLISCESVLCDTGMSLSMETQTGDYAVIGCTLSEGDTGLMFGWACSISISDDCSFESNTNCGIYTIIPLSVDNPNSESHKLVMACKFINNNVDIWINKETSAYAGGGFSWPMLIDCNTFASTHGLILRVTGNSPFDSQQFIFGASNTFSGGLVPLSKLDSNFRGYNAIKEQGKISVSATVTGVNQQNVATFEIPAGKSCIISKYHAISLDILASSGTTLYSAGVRFTDATNSIVLKEESGIVRGEDYVISSSGVGRIVVVALWSDNASHTATLSFTYKFY